MRLRFGLTVLIMLIVGFLNACHSPTPSVPPASGTTPDALEADLGGPAAVMEFFSTKSDQEITTLLARYGMNYVHHDINTQAIDECPKYFPEADRQTWHQFNGEFYYVDSKGRPYVAYKLFPPVAADPRWSSCQSKIGRWGDEYNDSQDYDGGHMIGSQLGGWGGRANIVPQQYNFNRGNWKSIEGTIAKCQNSNSLVEQQLLYYVRVNYPRTNTLIPSSFSLKIKDTIDNEHVWLNFRNEQYGGPNGPAEKAEGKAFLQARGCQ